MLTRDNIPGLNFLHQLLFPLASPYVVILKYNKRRNSIKPTLSKIRMMLNFRELNTKDRKGSKNPEVRIRENNIQ